MFPLFQKKSFTGLNTLPWFGEIHNYYWLLSWLLVFDELGSIDFFKLFYRKFYLCRNSILVGRPSVALQINFGSWSIFFWDKCATGPNTEAMRRKHCCKVLYMKVKLFVTLSCPTLWSRGCSLPGSSVHGILRARILKWVTTLPSR